MRVSVEQVVRQVVWLRLIRMPLPLVERAAGAAREWRKLDSGSSLTWEE